MRSSRKAKVFRRPLPPQDDSSSSQSRALIGRGNEARPALTTATKFKAGHTASTISKHTGMFMIHDTVTRKNRSPTWYFSYSGGTYSTSNIWNQKCRVNTGGYIVLGGMTRSTLLHILVPMYPRFFGKIVGNTYVVWNKFRLFRDFQASRARYFSVYERVRFFFLLFFLL